MSFKLQRSVGRALCQKNEDVKAVRHFEENNNQGDDLHKNKNKTDLSVQRLGAFKIPSRCSQFEFY